MSKPKPFKSFMSRQSIKGVSYLALGIASIFSAQAQAYDCGYDANVCEWYPGVDANSAGAAADSTITISLDESILAGAYFDGHSYYYDWDDWREVNAYAGYDYDENYVNQFAHGLTSAQAAINIAGTAGEGGRLTVEAVAIAHVWGDDEWGRAIAYVDTGIAQGARAESIGGNASAEINNGGAITVLADAFAESFNDWYADADADATVDQGIIQDAYVAGWNGTASVGLTNSGDVTVRAEAGASAWDYAAAEVDVYNGLRQHASASSAAYAEIINSGSISIEAEAGAFGGGEDGADSHANAFVQYGVTQDVTADGAAEAVIDNAGAITVQATAGAANFNTDAYATGEMDVGIGQFAGAYNASVSLTNSGSIDIVAKGAAIADDYASANAYLDLGIGQVADGASAFVDLTNSGSIEIGSLAQATGYAATAEAIITSTGISQEARAGFGLASVYLDNTGDISIVASASANAYYDADALAAINNAGISQYATADGPGVLASVGLTNAGTLNVVAQAYANGSYAFADAYIESGIYQYASANSGVASVDLTNSGELNILALATAYASDGNGNADAEAWIEGAGIYQSASGDYGDGHVDLTNDLTGTLNIVAGATATGSSYAQASATLSTGISQEASAYSYGGEDQRTATAGLTNSGTINIVASAYANGTGEDADAYANNYYGIEQNAYAEDGDATVDITNSGTLNIVAQATANANWDAYASATINTAISQSATAYGYDVEANAVVNNSGTLNIIAEANAVGDWASVDAYMDTGIYQYVYSSGGNATGDVTNSGTLNIKSVGNAEATDWNAYAYASISAYAINQDVYTDYGDASANLTNTGTINLVAAATATAYSFASASAYLHGGISQSATAYGSGVNASVDLNNSNTLNIVAQANAYGSAASAYASMSTGVYQYARVTTGTATATLTNSALINIHSIANATATNGLADASAVIESVGIFQEAFGNDGNATVGLTNTGVINIVANATANANGFADANATFDSQGISQSASAYGTGYSASIDLTNSGTINIVAEANAAGWGASAYASMSTGIYQNAYAESGAATVALTNSGALNIQSLASATATGTGSGSNDAFAGVVIESDAIYQEVDAYDGNAAAELTNTGTINIIAGASANANDWADAEATIDSQGISQSVYAYGTNTTVAASANLTNSGTLNIVAQAEAAGWGASAYASMSTGIYQYAYAYNGAASVDLTNSGTLNIKSMATATATGFYASASAVIESAGIYQEAYVDEGSATASLTNSGTINIVAGASANAYGNANAEATLDYQGIYQSAEAHGAAVSADAELTNSGTINIVADANAVGSSASAYASMSTGIYQYAYANSGAANASLTNTGTLNIQVLASASATGSDADAGANIESAAIYQEARGEYGDAAVSLTNSGTINIISGAEALANDWASADASFDSRGISQSAYAYGYGSEVAAAASLANSGTLNIVADANAVGWGASAYATMSTGIYQYAYVDSGVASASLTNSGTLNIRSLASASATGSNADAGAVIESAGIYQYAEVDGGSASVSLTNSGTLNIAAAADANAYYYAEANATFDSQGIYQSANADGVDAPAAVALTNSGTINLVVDANAVGSSAEADVYIETGIYQYAYADSGVASATLTNSGTVNVSLDADAAASSESAFASATLQNAGINQDVWGWSEANATLTNSGNIVIQAHASAEAYSEAYATANLNAGVVQEAHAGFDAALSLTNSGNIVLAAHADAISSDSEAYAYAYATPAVGQYAFASSAASVSLTNSGNILASAVADASGDSYAWASASATAVSQVAIGEDAASLSINNSGHISVLAKAAAANSSSSAYALGTYQGSPSADITLTNSGVISVAAVVADGGNASATAIVVDSLAGTVTVTNTGGISAKVSTDGGATYQHGVAIDLSTASSDATINLKGGANSAVGKVYGDILIAEGQVINVKDGETWFDGHINPVDAFAPASVSGNNLVGDLNILSNGTLYMRYVPRSNVYFDDASAGFVNNLNIDGTLKMDLITSKTAATAQAVHPTISANSATFGSGSTFMVMTTSQAMDINDQVANNYLTNGAHLPSGPYATENGLYANAYTFDNVIASNDMTGTFSNVVTSSRTPLLRLTANYDAQDNFDLNVTRVAFGGVGIENHNQAAAGSGLEKVYSTSVTGTMLPLFQDLFQMDTAHYLSAMQQLSGSQYASYLQSLRTFSSQFVDGVLPYIECGVGQCSEIGKGRVWGSVSYRDMTADGDAVGGYFTDSANFAGQTSADAAKAGAPGYKIRNQFTQTMGVDFVAGPDLLLGALISHSSATQKFNDDDRNGTLKSKGFRFGAYANYEPGNLVVKALATYGQYNADMTRSVSLLNAVNDGGNAISGKIYGSPDAKQLSLYGQIGYKYDLSKAVRLTPYVGLEYVNTKIDSMTETTSDHATAALLTVHGKESGAIGQIGFKLEGLSGKVRPFVNAALRHNFGEKQVATDMAYAGAPTGTFTVLSAAEKLNSAVVNAGLTAEVAKNVEINVIYNGSFRSGATDNSGRIGLIYKFGAK